MVLSLQRKFTAGSVLKMLMLMALIGGILYALAIYYLAFNTDKALREQMSLEFKALRLPLPQELQNIEPAMPVLDQFEEAYDADESGLFTLPLNQQAQLIATSERDSALPTDSDLPYQPAVQRARARGSDLRSIYTSDGVRIRLFTFRLPPNLPISYLQVGRLVADEDLIKHRMLLILFGLCLGLTVISGGVSWVLTGRSLRPTWYLLERQQTFVANASHELRTPLTLIRASTQVVQRNLGEDERHRQLLDDVLSETDYMSKLVDDLLLLSRLDAGQVKLELHALALSEVISKLRRQFSALADERGVCIAINRAEGTVLADPTRLWQILLIVTDNALRNTPEGGTILLDARVSERTVQITVSDTGNGIAPESLPHVFERFYKAEESRSDRRTAGLGLSIAKPIIELHHGDIRIESTLGVGTRVTITLPAQPEPLRIGPAPKLSATAG